MKISAIIPMYNSKETIKSAIESVLNQTYKDSIEIVVINDGSTDGCEKIVEQMISENQTNRIIKLISKTNGGVSSARNRGIKESQGTWVAFLDSDDIWHPIKLEIIANLLNSNKNINFIGHPYTLYDFDVYNNQNKMILKSISLNKLLLRNLFQTSCVLVNKNIVQDFNQSMTHMEDYELWLRIALNNNLYLLNIPLTKLNRPQLSFGGLSGNKWEMRKGEIKAYINISKKRKMLIIFLPILIFYSLSKHILKLITLKIKK